MSKRGFEFISEKQMVEDGVSEGLHKLPERGTSHSAGYDFYSPIDFVLEPNQFVKIPTAVKAYMLADEVLQIYIRSSLGFKHNLRIVNQTGIIDSDFYNNEGNEGHIWIKIQNEGTEKFEIKAGDRIAQGIFSKYLLVDGDKFEGKERKGGTGSTGE
ncbi:MAG: dUTP diphosphatase [bacterium]